MKIKTLCLMLSFAFFLNSCKSQSTDFEGKWMNENNKIEIIKNGNSYIVEINSKKYPAEIKNNLLVISTEMPIKASIIDDKLITNGDEYLREKAFHKIQKIKYTIEGKKELKKAFKKISEVYSRRNTLIGALLKMMNRKIDNSVTDKFNSFQKISDDFEITKVNIDKYMKTQVEIGKLAAKLINVIEKYPEIESNQHYLEIMSQLEGTENRIKIMKNRFNKISNLFNLKYNTDLPFIKSVRKSEKAPKVNF